MSPTSQLERTKSRLTAAEKERQIVLLQIRDLEAAAHKRCDELQKERDEAQATVEALLSSNCNMNDTLRARGFTAGSTEDRVIALAQAYDEIGNWSVTQSRQRITALENALREVRKAFELIQFDTCSPQVEHQATKALQTLSALNL